jgi:hypothetical protein
MVSKKHHVSSVKASSPIVPAEFVQRFQAAAKSRGFRLDVFGEAAGCPLIAVTKRTAGPRPRIYLSSGIHGDEPAPPLALLTLLERGFFDDRATWFVCPLLNPAGFLRASRENAEGFDLNRDYKATRSREIAAHIDWLKQQPNFDLTLCLHEDWEATGFYLYELDPGPRPALAEPIITAVAKVHPIDPANLIDGREARGGIIRPEGDPSARELWAESIYLRAHHHALLSYTIETPSGLPLESRTAAQCTAVEAAIAAATLSVNISVG